jgi:hypothetical protein
MIETRVKDRAVINIQPRIVIESSIYIKATIELAAVETNVKMRVVEFPIAVNKAVMNSIYFIFFLFLKNPSIVEAYRGRGEVSIS